MDAHGPSISELLLTSIDDEAVFALDEEGAVTWWGTGAERLLGRAGDVALGETFPSLFAEESRGDAERALGIARGRGRFEGEVDWIRTDGRPFRAGLSIRALDPGGQRAGFGVVARDLMDRIRAERALQEGSARVSLLQVIAVAANEASQPQEALRAGIDAVCTHTGWPLAHSFLLGPEGNLEPTGIWHGDGPFPHFREATERARFGPGEGLLGEVLVRGRPAWVEDVGSDPGFLRRPSADLDRIRMAVAVPLLVGPRAAGVLEFYSPTAVPPDPALLEVLAHIGAQLGRVIERASAEDALRLSEAKFAGIASISTDAIVSVNEAQIITFYNAGAEMIFGHSAEEAIGEPLELLIPHRHRADHAEKVRAFGRSPVPARRMGERGRIAGLRRNGEVFPADASISRIEVDGRTIYTAVLRDITERKAAEEALERQAAELARSNAELEQFASVASHDLQEPLRKIQAFGDRLLTRYAPELDEQGLDYVRRMHGAAGRMQTLINDLLTFSRVTTKAQPFQSVDLGRLTEEVLTDLELRIEQSGAQVEVGPLPVIEADPMQMRQLLLNLLANALKFRRPDVPPRIRVESHPSPRSRKREGRWIELAVSDNGIGFEEKYLDRIFSLFQRLHGRSEYEGTGMGLAICRKIAERHGGSIDARSVPGEGSTFTVTLPTRSSGEDA